ncbi:hypothetical protein KPATCC21470_8696 [Kitasatospora purpeofusca]
MRTPSPPHPGTRSAGDLAARAAPALRQPRIHGDGRADHLLPVGTLSCSQRHHRALAQRRRGIHQTFGGDLREARRLWRAARCAEQKRIRLQHGLASEGTEGVVGVLAVKLSAHLATRPQLVDSFGQLRWAMIELRARSGQPSLARIEKLAGHRPDGSNHLPSSSLGAILRLQAVPLRDHVTAFARAMGASEVVVEKWGAARDRAAGRSNQSGSPGRPAAARRPTAQRFIEVRIRPLPTEGPAHGSDFTPEDIAFLRSHAPADLRGIGPCRPLPPAGYTSVGLPIRVPRLLDRLRLRGRRPEPRIVIGIPRAMATAHPQNRGCP